MLQYEPLAQDIVTTFWGSLGQVLGEGYFALAMVLLLGCLGPHFIVLAAYAFVKRRPLPIFLAIEVAYGFVNIVAYLLVFQPGIFRSATPAWLPPISWAFLSVYWISRLTGSLWGRERRVIVRGILLACALIAVAVGIRDLVFLHSYSVTWALSESLFTAAIVSPLYLIPVTIALRQFRHLGEGDANGFFLKAKSAQVFSLLASAFALISIAVAAWSPGEEAAKDIVRANRNDIVAASRRANLDPRIVASIVFVTQAHYVSPFSTAIEETLAATWLVDRKSHGLLASSIDSSLGLAQIKPVTLQTAIAIWRESQGLLGQANKEFRDIPARPHQWAVPQAGSSSYYPVPPLGDSPSKGNIVRALLDPHGNIVEAAFLLNLYAAHWEGARREWSIRNRPDILATLFQLGFQQSVPKANPRSNEFGVRVKAAFESAWMIETFPEHTVHGT